jgi:hypothetical protein
MLRTGGRRTRVTMKQAIERGLQPAPCCATWLQKKLDGPAAPAVKKPAAPIRSAFDAIASLEDADQDLVLSWLARLTPEQLVTLSAHLNSASEAAVLARCLRAGFPAAQTLQLLEDQSSRTLVRREVSAAVRAVKDTIAGVGEQVVDGAREVAGRVDSGLEPLADTLEQIEGQVKQPASRPQLSWWQQLMNMMRL